MVIRIGLTGTVLMVCEGAVLGWGAIYLHENRGATVAVASIAITAFAGGQTAGRVIGDRLTVKFGASSLFRTCGLIGVVGLTMAVLSPWPAVAIGGFAVLGLGLRAHPADLQRGRPRGRLGAGRSRLCIEIHHLHLRRDLDRPRGDRRRIATGRTHADAGGTHSDAGVCRARQPTSFDAHQAREPPRRRSGRGTEPGVIGRVRPSKIPT